MRDKVPDEDTDEVVFVQPGYVPNYFVGVYLNWDNAIFVPGGPKIRDFEELYWMKIPELPPSARNW